YERQQRIAEALEKGDAGLAEYLKGVDELYRQAEQRRLETLLRGEGSLAQQQQEAIAELAQEYERQAAEAVTAEQAKQAAIVATNAALREQVELMRATAITATSSRAAAQSSVSAAQGMTTGQQIAQPIAPTLPAFPDQEQIAEKIDVPLSVMLDRLERALQDVRGAIELS
ncbi:MAG: hypothetical protein N2379_11265, partial [Verrucomicrobiae bacterium]|nr:hypothetical protein [Verrucomicrobiae bacterium]